MSAEKATNGSRRLLLLALIFLANPNVHVVDILPDFIAYLIIARVLSYPAPRAPYFEEARTGMLKLALISALKVPAFFILNYVRSGNYSDNDILSLFSFSFGVAEAIFTVIAINTLFTALFYLGERTDATVLLSPFPISKRGRRMTPEGLRVLAIIFTIIKCAGYALPELLLLTKSVDAGSVATYFNVARLYPYVIVLSVIVVLTLGIITASRFNKYIKTVEKDGGFYPAVDSLTRDGAIEELQKKLRIKDMKTALLIIAIACVLTFELRFDNYSSIDLMPHFVFTLVLAYGLYRLGRYTVGAVKGIVALLVSSAISAAAFVAECVFLVTYGYEQIATEAYIRNSYLTTVILYGVELIALSVALIIAAHVVCKFVIMHTGVEPESERYMRTDAEAHQKMKSKVYIWCGLGMFSGACKFLNVLFKLFSKNIFVSVGEGIDATTGVVAESFLPWFGTVVLASAIAFAGWSLYLFSSLREDCELKYT